MDKKQDRLSQLHEHRRIAIMGSPEEKRQLQQHQRVETENQLKMKQERLYRDKMADKAEERKQLDHERSVMAAESAKQSAKRDMATRINQDNMFVAGQQQATKV